MTETRKLAAILAADVVGYSRLAVADEERILARFRALRQRRQGGVASHPYAHELILFIKIDCPPSPQHPSPDLFCRRSGDDSSPER